MIVSRLSSLFLWIFFMFMLESEEFSVDLSVLPKQLHTNIHCRDRERLVISESAMHQHVIVELNRSVGLTCRFCDEDMDDGMPKVWYRKELRSSSNVKLEVPLSMESSYTNSRVFVTQDHTLYIVNATPEDSSVYYCLGPEGEHLPDSIEYNLDVIDLTNVVTISGDSSMYGHYLETEFTEMNNRFLNANEHDYKEVRDKGIQLKVVSDLSEDTVTDCDGCTGVRQYNVSCRLEASLMVDYQKNVEDVNAVLLEKENQLLQQFEVSCYSVDFAKSYPIIGMHLKSVRNFILLEECWAPCRGNHKSKNAPIYSNRLTVNRGSSVTLVCPGAKPETKLTWLKNGRPIKYRADTDNLFVDPFSTLFIMSVSKYDNGNYTCIISGDRILETLIVVTGQNVNTYRTFVREAYYLSLTNLLAFIIYLTVIIALWTTRYRFYVIDFDALENPPDNLSDDKILLTSDFSIQQRSDESSG